MRRLFQATVLMTTALVLIGSKGSLLAQEVQTYEPGPVHEAFIQKIIDVPVLEAIAQQPPEPINERIPKQSDMQAEWISGYWAWDAYLNDFVWVSGVWRRPPPGHLWISGFWKQYESGWTWIPGYWGHVLVENTTYIEVAPPDPIDENMTALPSDDYFWASGYWFFLFDQQEYRWVPGHWEELDPNWVYVRAHYAWRPGGYVFIPPYWDWPIEERGTAYAPVKIDSMYRYRIVYEPLIVLQQSTIIQSLFTTYPDYVLFLHHHYHFHPDYWNSFCCAPPWWNWGSWWGLTWNDHWGLWWWYSHPGYPQPLWLTPDLSAIIPQPLSQLSLMLERVKPPLIITPNGVASQGEILRALQKTTGKFSPILPKETKELKKVQQLARPLSLEPQKILKPLGKQLPIEPRTRPHIRKPLINPEKVSQSQLLKEDRRPKTPFKPKIPLNKRESIWHQGQGRETQGRERPAGAFESPPSRRPIWTPRSSESPIYSPNYQPRKEEDREEKWKPRSGWSEPPIKRSPIYHDGRGSEMWEKTREKEDKQFPQRGQYPVRPEMPSSTRGNEERPTIQPPIRRVDSPGGSFRDPSSRPMIQPPARKMDSPGESFKDPSSRPMAQPPARKMDLPGESFRDPSSRPMAQPPARKMDLPGESFRDPSSRPMVQPPARKMDLPGESFRDPSSRPMAQPPARKMDLPGGSFKNPSPMPQSSNPSGRRVQPQPESSVRSGSVPRDSSESRSSKESSSKKDERLPRDSEKKRSREKEEDDFN